MDQVVQAQEREIEHEGMQWKVGNTNHCERDSLGDK